MYSSLLARIACLIMICAFTLTVGALSSQSAFAAPDETSSDSVEGDVHGGHDTTVPIGWERDLVLWTLITFVLFVIVLKKVAWGPLVDGLDNRESKYRKLLGDAQADRDRALQMLAEYEAKLKSAQTDVDEIIAEARRDAARTKTDIIAAANTEAETTRNRALDDIGRARDQALDAIFEHMRDNVVAATEKVLARSLSSDDHQRLVDEALAEVSAN